jgi:DNA mismatch endonuclease (patch repair protein)
MTVKILLFPKTNVAFWTAKIQSNVDRDSKHYTILERGGWRVLVIWECQIEKDVSSASQIIIDNLNV